MFNYLEYDIDTETVNKILKKIKESNFNKCPVETCTKNGFQSENILKIFNTVLIKKIIPINELYKKIIHIHYIRYKKAGYQEEHLHKPDNYSFILYLNNSDGDTILKDPINKRFTPKKGKVIVFSGQIFHYAEPSYKGKKVLVGAIK